MAAELPEIARRLAAAGRRFDARGWVLGTSGNFSAVITRDPLRLAKPPGDSFWIARAESPAPAEYFADTLCSSWYDGVSWGLDRPGAAPYRPVRVG